MDISTKIEHLKAKREETPAAAATPSQKTKAQEGCVTDLKTAKASEFPVRPVGQKKSLPNDQRGDY